MELLSNLRNNALLKFRTGNFITEEDTDVKAFVSATQMQLDLSTVLLELPKCLDEAQIAVEMRAQQRDKFAASQESGFLGETDLTRRTN